MEAADGAIDEVGGSIVSDGRVDKERERAGIGFSAFDTTLSLCSLLRRLKRRLQFVYCLVTLCSPRLTFAHALGGHDYT